jgi:tRNA A37 threonylcarbamoyladenosine modification protein TsaB
MQGLAFVGGRPMVAVSALEALAHAGSHASPIGALVGVWIDAHRGDIFSAAYRVADAPPFTPARLIEIEGAAVGRPGVTMAEWQQRWGAPALLIGDGALMYGAAALDTTRLIAPPPLAGAIGRLAVARARAGGAINPAAVTPLYVRRPDAELTRERGALAPTALAKNGKARP